MNLVIGMKNRKGQRDSARLKWIERSYWVRSMVLFVSNLGYHIWKGLI